MNKKIRGEKGIYAFVNAQCSNHRLHSRFSGVNPDPIARYQPYVHSFFLSGCIIRVK